MGWCSAVLLGALVLGGCVTEPSGSVAGYGGSYEGEGLALVLHEGDGVVRGALTFQGSRYPVEARPEGAGLVGTFQSDATRYDLRVARQPDGRLLVTTAGRTYALLPEGGPNPLAHASTTPTLAQAAPAAPAPRPAPAPAAPTWSGSWPGDIGGTPGTLALRESGGRITGTIDANGYTYALEATPAGASSARGRIVDNQNGAVMDLALERSAGGVAVTVSGPAGGATFQFGSGGAAVAAPGAAAAPRAATSGAAGGDPALIGSWGRNETMMSDDFSMVTRRFLHVNADGTYRTGTGESYAGGDAGTITTGGETGSGGRWKTEGNIVHVDFGNGWEPYARYYIEGGSLMLTYGNGTKEVWHRR